MALTYRFLRGLISLSTILILFIINRSTSEVFIPFLDSIQADITIAQNIETLSIFAICLIVLCLVVGWAYRNSLKKGLKYAVNHYRLTLKIRSELVKTFIRTEGFLVKNFVRLPHIKITFDDNLFRYGQVLISNSVVFDKYLENIRLESALRQYIVTNRERSQDGNEYIFNIMSINEVKQPVFNTKKSYIDWALSSTDNYSIRIDERFMSLPLHHMALAGQTGSGKSMLIQAFLYQLLSKSVGHEIFIIDPKRTDVYFLGKSLLPNANVADAFSAPELLKKFEERMLNRQAELEDYFMLHPNATYKDAGLPAIILLIDEFSSLRGYLSSLPKAERDYYDSIIKRVAYMGRQLGCLLWIGSQQINANTLPTDIRDNLPLKIIIGNADEMTFRTLFSSSVEIPKVIFQTGQGVMSFPKIASINNPVFIYIPYFEFLKTKN